MTTGSEGTKTINLDLQNLNQGLYQVILRTTWDIITVPMMIMK
jgi:hypothetical protein